MADRVCDVALSRDGRLAHADGAVDRRDAYPPEPEAFAAFLASVDALLMGRATQDLLRGFGDWSYPGKAATVLTGRPLADAPPGMRAPVGPPRRTSSRHWMRRIAGSGSSAAASWCARRCGSGGWTGCR